MNGKLIQTIGLAAISGLRTMSGPAFLARTLQQNPPDAWPHDALRQLATEPAPTLLQLMAAGELFVDKLPFIPARITPGALAARAASGATVGATLGLLQKRSALLGALLGAVAAITTAYAGYRARRWLTVEKGLPDFPVALLEDAITLGVGTRLTR